MRPRDSTWQRGARRFFLTPKGLLIIILAALAALAAPAEGLRLVAPGLAAATVTAAVLDAAALRIKNGAWEFPSGAVLSGLLIAMVLSPHEPWYVPACTSIVAIASKYLLRTRSANVFNPAALALVVTFYIFDTAQNWWGALPALALWGLPVLLVTGTFIANRVNKLPLVLSFLGGYFLLFTVSAFAGDPGRVAEIFRTPDAQAALFFAFFFLTDPPTSPVRYPGQLASGAVVAIAGFAIFEWLGAAHYLLAGVLAGNVLEAVMRVRDFRSRRLSRA